MTSIFCFFDMAWHTFQTWMADRRQPPFDPIAHENSQKHFHLTVDVPEYR